MYKSDCRSKVQGYLNTYDMTGNVMEWIDSCKGSTTANDDCLVAAGSYKTADPTVVKCSSTAHFIRSYSGFDTGFRCCTDP